MCHSIVGSTTYIAPEILSRRNLGKSSDGKGYDGAKVGTGNASFLLSPPGDMLKPLYCLGGWWAGD